MNDHIDDLFRRAADNYPLNTEGADWNKVLSGLQQSPGNDDGKSPKKNPRRLLWLFLLLPVVLIAYHYIKPASTPDKPATVETIAAPTPAQTTQQNQHSPLAGITTNNATPGASSQKQQSTIKVPPVPPNTQTKPSGTMVKAATSGFARHGVNAGLVKKRTPVHAYQAAADKPQLATSTPTINSTDASKATSHPTIDPVEVKPENKSLPVQSKAEPVVTAADNLATATKQPGIEPATKSPAVTLKRLKDAGPAKQFYVGLLAGSDMNFVEYQKVYKLGMSAGVVAGYSFNNRVAVEAGAFLQQKHYYSSGEYFDIKRTSIPANYKIESIAGKCTMVDVALNVRYNFINRGSASWFAAAGVSSYIMKKELYDYSYKYNWQTMFRRLNYNNSTNNFLAVGNISIGYQHRFSRGLNARIEPYVKVPLKGIGIGNIPLMSAGVQAGFTKSIF